MGDDEFSVFGFNGGNGDEANLADGLPGDLLGTTSRVGNVGRVGNPADSYRPEEPPFLTPARSLAAEAQRAFPGRAGGRKFLAR